MSGRRSRTVGHNEEVLAMLADQSTRAPRHRRQDTFNSVGITEADLPRFDLEADAVRFKLPGENGDECAIDREALDLLCSQRPADPVAYANIYREHRAWIHALARIELEYRSDRALVLGSAAVRFQLACEATDVPTVICV
jgi:hypothetical protein